MVPFRPTTTASSLAGYRAGTTGTSSRTLSRPLARMPVPYRPRYFTITGPSGSAVETSILLPPSRTLAPAKAGSTSRSTTPRVAVPTARAGLRARARTGGASLHRVEGEPAEPLPVRDHELVPVRPPGLVQQEHPRDRDLAEAVAHERATSVIRRERGAHVGRFEEGDRPPLVAGRAAPAEQGDVVLGAPVEGLLHRRRLGPPVPAFARHSSTLGRQRH